MKSNLFPTTTYAGIIQDLSPPNLSSAGHCVSQRHGCFSPIADAQLCEDVGHVLLDRLFMHAEAEGYPLVAQTFGHEVQDFLLAVRQIVDRICLLCQGFGR